MAPIIYRACEAYPEIKFVAPGGDEMNKKYSSTDFYPEVNFFYKGRQKKEFNFNVGYRPALEQRLDEFLESIQQ